MTTRKRLSSAEREFFELVARTAFANPFSAQRAELDQRIVGAGPEVPRGEAIDRVLAAVGARLQTLETELRADPGAYTAEDAGLLKAAYLFDLFHRYLDRFDQLIEEEAASRERPRTVRFARAALGDLAGCGFTEAEAVDYFALFYQLRRAYFLIYRNLVGGSRSMGELRLQLWQNVFTHDMRLYQQHLWNRMEDFSTLLLGETGTGKGAAAAAIGRSGFIPFEPQTNRFADSFTESFIGINLSQFSESLLESEIFGHRKGAFTGAVDQHDGILTRCSPYGAIFLDEIGDVSVHAQIKLLKVLEEREFSPVGSHERVRFQGRIIAATHRDLHALRGAGRFRDDFYYRLCSDSILVPPLRQRIAEEPGEFRDMIAHLVQRLLGEPVPELEDLVEATLSESPGPDYAWPGNVRELEQAVRRVILNQQYAGDHRGPAADPFRQLAGEMEDGHLTASSLLARYCKLLYERHQNYVEVARRTGLDRRTVKKHVESTDE